MTEDDLPPPPQNAGHSSLAPPPISFSQSDINWPIKDLGISFFDRALANGGVSAEGLGATEESAANGGDEPLDAWATEDVDVGGEDGDVNGDGEDEGWDLDAEVIAPEEEVGMEVDEIGAGGGEADLSEGVSKGVGEDEWWVRNSPLAADHAAAGSYESAMQVSGFPCYRRRC